MSLCLAVRRLVGLVGSRYQQRWLGIRLEGMLGDYSKLTKAAKKGAEKVSVICILPRNNKSMAINSRILSLTMQLEKMCKDMNVTFLMVFFFDCQNLFLSSSATPDGRVI